MILDGNVNPVSWTHPDGIQPVFLRLGSGRAAAASMTAFLNLCGSHQHRELRVLRGHPGRDPGQVAGAAAPAAAPSGHHRHPAAALHLRRRDRLGAAGPGQRVAVRRRAPTATVDRLGPGQHLSRGHSSRRTGPRPSSGGPVHHGRPQPPRPHRPTPGWSRTWPCSARTPPTRATRAPIRRPPGWPTQPPAGSGRNRPGPPNRARTGPTAGPRTATPGRGTGPRPAPSCCSATPATRPSRTGTPSRWPTTWPGPGC